MNDIISLTLGQIVALHPKAAIVFEKYRIDFCCQGKRNFADTCHDAGLNPENIAIEVNSLASDSRQTDFTNWPLDLLSDYIYKRHHLYIEQTTPTIKNLLEKICSVHGRLHPELLEIQEIFNETSGQLAAHMKKEELILFPFIRKLVRAKAENNAVTSTLFSSVLCPIENMEDEHLNEGEQLERMAQLSNNFTAPNDACLTYITAYKMLKEYEQDMHTHIHLENNVLFPAAIKLEQQLAAVQG